MELMPPPQCGIKELKSMSIAEEKEMLELESLIEEHGLTGKAPI